MFVYNWLVFLHVVGVLSFMLAHGVSVSVAFALRHERHTERVRALLELSANSYGLMYISLLVILVSGVIVTFLGGYWNRGWIWISLILLIAISAAMGALGGRFYSEARKAAGLPYHEQGKAFPAQPARSPEEVEAVLAKANPILLAVIGLGGLLVIVWLMMFKPF